MAAHPALWMVDDDEEDVYITKRAFLSHEPDLLFDSVSDGVELFDYMDRQGRYRENTSKHAPTIILLDINLPCENGFDILSRLKSHPIHRQIPIIMLTTSSSELDVRKAYGLGASSYVCKSLNAAEMKEIAAKLCDYWFNFSAVPAQGGNNKMTSDPVLI